MLHLSIQKKSLNLLYQLVFEKVGELNIFQASLTGRRNYTLGISFLEFFYYFYVIIFYPLLSLCKNNFVIEKKYYYYFFLYKFSVNITSKASFTTLIDKKMIGKTSFYVFPV